MLDYEFQLKEFNALSEHLFDSFKSRKGLFRFNRAAVIASDVAQQYYCEKKVEMNYIQGEVETEEKTIGSEAHEKLLKDTVKIEGEELWKEIYSELPSYIHEMLLLARYKEVILAGRPDLIIFKHGKPLVFFEYKFGRSKKPFKSHHVQAGVYGTLLKNMGFDTDQLYYILVLAKPKAKYEPNFREKIVEAVEKNGLKESIIKIENACLYITKFDTDKASQDLDWAIDFWKNHRKPIPTRNPNKCRSCEFNKECDQSLIKFRNI
jgi:CRISPR/Cas system-associated exonuclease Cas4 (RecB family)